MPPPTHSPHIAVACPACHPQALISFLEAWEAALPRAALQHILDMLVMPKLRAAVTLWEPRQVCGHVGVRAGRSVQCHQHSQFAARMRTAHCSGTA